MSNNSQIIKRWACVENGKVEMVVVWDGILAWPPADDYEMVEIAQDSPVSSGWDYVDGQFVDNLPADGTYEAV